MRKQSRLTRASFLAFATASVCASFARGQDATAFYVRPQANVHDNSLLLDLSPVSSQPPALAPAPSASAAGIASFNYSGFIHSQLKSPFEQKSGDLAPGPSQGPATGPSAAQPPQDYLGGFLGGFSLSKSSDDTKNGALLSVTRDTYPTAGTPTLVASADFYLSWDSVKSGLTSKIDPTADLAGMLPGVPINFTPSVEGHLTSNSDATLDSWKFKCPVDYLWVNKPLRFAVDLSISPNYQADRDFKTEQLTGELAFSPTVQFFDKNRGALQAFNWGQDTTFWNGSGHALVIDYRPSVAFDWGDTLHRAAGVTTPGTVEQLTPSLHLSGTFGNVDTLHLAFSAVESWTYVPNGGDRGYNYFTAGVSVMANKITGLSVSYDIGRDAPSFKKAETLKVSLVVAI